MSKASIAPLLPLLFLVATAAVPPGDAPAAPAPLSGDSETCLGCHSGMHSGIVGDWQRSRHARTTPAAAAQLPELSRRVSAAEVPEALRDVVVGCAECHTLRADAHPDAFEHNGFRIHTVVSPDDCAVCHPTERGEFADNLMANAHGNLMGNALYQELAKQVLGPATAGPMGLVRAAPASETLADACLACHGTRIVAGPLAVRETVMGEMEFPTLAGWPNQGVGRINPDGSLGACTACHTRHEFSIAMARGPATCAQCHKGPDVPAARVYEVSKHGNIFAARGAGFDLEAVPWQAGRDFTAPTCATCHASLVVDGDGTVLAPRTHRMNDRLPWRLLGLPFAHPHPISADTTPIRNADGLPLPTAFDGRPAAEFLIDDAEQAKRRAAMRGVCTACHAGGWVDGHMAKLDATVAETNAATAVATNLLLDGWRRGIAQGPAAGGSPFDEPIERLWVESWLFYANAARLASAMGGADYGVFAEGRWQLARAIAELHERTAPAPDDVTGSTAATPDAKGADATP